MSYKKNMNFGKLGVESSLLKDQLFAKWRIYGDYRKKYQVYRLKKHHKLIPKNEKSPKRTTTLKSLQSIQTTINKNRRIVGLKSVDYLKSLKLSLKHEEQRIIDYFYEHIHK